MTLLGDAGESILREPCRRALIDAEPHAELTGAKSTADAIAARHWSMACELGWTSILLDERDGGIGLGLDELVALSEEIGAHLFCGPWLASAVLAPGLLALSRSRAQDFEWPGTGAAISLAVPRPLPDSTGATRYLGEHPDLASHYLLIDETSEPWGVSCRLLAATDVRLLSRPTALDPTCPVAELVPAADGLGERIETFGDDAARLLRPVHLAIAAELNGVCAAILERAVAWVGERKQFGRPVGSFQGVKHRLADAYANFTKALACARAAAGSDDPYDAQVARVIASEAAARAGRDYIQHLGGAGISWEYDAHLYLKRAVRLNAIPPVAGTLSRVNTDRFIACIDV